MPGLNFIRPLLLTISLFLLYHTFCYGQEFYPITNSLFNWKKYEQTDKKQILAFIKIQKSYFQKFDNKDEYSSLTMDTLIKSLHIIDLDKDGIAEVIFDGPSGGEGNEIIIFQKINGKYQQVFTGIQSIVDIQWQNNGNTKIYISNFGCCADYTVTQKIFKLTKIENNKIKLIKVYQSLLFFNGSQPDSLFFKPLRFRVMVDNYKLRHTPKLDDSSAQPWDGDNDSSKPIGNIIATLPKNTFGYALGYKADKSGRQWWYVEIDEQSSLRNIKLDSEIIFPSKLVGWTSSTYLEIQ